MGATVASERDFDNQIRALPHAESSFVLFKNLCSDYSVLVSPPRPQIRSSSLEQKISLINPSPSAAPTTAACSTAGCAMSTLSTSVGETHCPAHLQHVVCASTVPEVAIRILGIGVTGGDPVTLHGVPCLLALVPEE
jgi:hypothetical protein